MAAEFQLGLVTYQWGAEWDLPTLLKNLQDAELGGVELRVDHKHGVSPALSEAQRRAARTMFDESGITLVGLGCNWDFHHTDAEKLKANIDGARQWIALGHDVGGTGVKVKPNDLPKDVPAEKTIAQIGKALRELGEFGEGFGQQIRLEIHGRDTSKIPVIRQIMEATDHANVALCWNCNPADLEGPGLEANFNSVKRWLGETTHIHELESDKYPHAELLKLLKKARYTGWTLLECGTKVADGVEAMRRQRALFEKMTR